MSNYKPESIINIIMEKLYRHSYCIMDDIFVDETINIINEHEYYSKYELKIDKINDYQSEITLVGKKIYSF